VRPARGSGGVSQGTVGVLMIVIWQHRHNGLGASHWQPGTCGADDARRLDCAKSQHVGAYPLPSIWLVDGFGIACGGFAGPAAISALCFLLSPRGVFPGLRVPNSQDTFAEWGKRLACHARLSRRGRTRYVPHMSTQELLLEEIKRQPEPVLLEVWHYLKFLTRQREEEAWADVLPSRQVEQEVLDHLDSK